MAQAHSRVGSASIQPVSGTGAAESVRLVDLSPGQQVTATVLETSADGRVRIGMFGARIAAFSHLSLEVGKSYQFEVTAIEPQIVLSAARSVRVPSYHSAMRAGQLGASSQKLARALAELSRILPAGATEDIRALVEALSTGLAKSDDLEGLHQRLGHDQEARVLRLAQAAPKTERAEVMQLRRTLKAMVLAMVESGPAWAATGADAELLAQLLSGLNQIEVENAQRVEQGAPLHLPLPINPGSELVDARLFLLPPPTGEAESKLLEGSEREWSIVLLLELSRLGALRVDIRVRGEQVTVSLQMIEQASSVKLRDSLGLLENDLEAVGLEVQSLTLRHARVDELPVADLVLPPPSTSDPAALVDLHV